MGMFSEIHAEGEAIEYEKILIEGIKSNNNDIFEFCKKHIYPKYQSALSDAWRTKITENQKIVDNEYGKF